MNGALCSPHVLLVDDAPDIRALLRDVLEDEGYRVTSTSSVQDVGTIRELAPDLIVHDLLFAERGPASWSFLQALRQDPHIGHLPVILCTADGRVQTDPALAEQVQRLALRVINKPFDLAEFLALLDSVLPLPGETPHRSVHPRGEVSAARTLSIPGELPHCCPH